MRLFASLLLLLGSAIACCAQETDLGRELQKEWVGKLAVITGGPLDVRSLASANGDLVRKHAEAQTAAKEVPVGSLVHIDSLQVEPGRLLVRFTRKAMEFDPHKAKIASVTGNSASLELKIPANATATDMRRYLQLSFATSDDLAELAPPYLQACARGRISPGPRDQYYCTLPDFPLPCSLKQSKSPIIAYPHFELAGAPGPRYTLTTRKVRQTDARGVQVPQPISTPNPDRDSKPPKGFRGRNFVGSLNLAVIVNEQGTVQDVQVVRPLGHGLDDSAAAAVLGWKFKPATQNGTAVPVGICVEVNFRLWQD